MMPRSSTNLFLLLCVYVLLSVGAYTIALVGSGMKSGWAYTGRVFPSFCLSVTILWTNWYYGHLIYRYKLSHSVLCRDVIVDHHLRTLAKNIY